jgi:hypothetical protein
MALRDLTGLQQGIQTGDQNCSGSVFESLAQQRGYRLLHFGRVRLLAGDDVGV